MCSAQKCTFWQRGAEPTTCKGPERLLRTSAVSDLDIPTTYHKCVSCVFKSLSRTVRMPQQSRCRHERRLRSSNLFLGQRICLHSDTHRQSHWKGSYDHTAHSFSQSLMLLETRSPKQASEGAQNQTRE